MRLLLLAGSMCVLSACGRIGFASSGGSGPDGSPMDAAVLADGRAGTGDGFVPLDDGETPDSGGEDGGRATCGDPVPLDGLLRAIAEAVCAELDVAIIGKGPFPLDFPACVGQLSSLLGVPDSELGQVVAQAQAGRLSYDAAAAGACIRPCTPAPPFLLSAFTGTACDSMFAGTTSLGAACTHSFECAGDAYCRLVDALGSCGVCTAAIPIGAPCSNTESCTDTTLATCAVARDMTRRCLEVVETTGVGVGLDCGETGVSNRTMDYSYCAADLSCTPFLSGMGTCMDPAPAGAVCAGACEPGLACVGTCAPYEIVTVEGGACGQDESTGVWRFCSGWRGLSCEALTCVCLAGPGLCAGAPRELGEPCAIPFFTLPTCRVGLACGLPRGVCVDLLAAGASCSAGSLCQSGTCDGTCAANWCGAIVEP